MTAKKFKVGDKVGFKDELTVYKVFNYAISSSYIESLVVLLKLEGEDFICSAVHQHHLEHIEEELKIDKVGHYYRLRNGDLVKILHISKNNFLEPVTFLNVKDDSVSDCSLNGKHYDHENEKIMESDYNIVEYIGPELPIERREFKFEAYIGENKKIKPNSSYSIQRVLTNECTIPYTNKDHIDMGDFEKISKWEITMKEIFE